MTEEKVEPGMRWETTSEHIARDMAEGRFPQQSERKQVPDSSELKPCPFCGSEPRVGYYETESLWSHDQITYTKVECPECEIAFHSEPGYEVEAPEAWNRRAPNRRTDG